MCSWARISGPLKLCVDMALSYLGEKKHIRTNLTHIEKKIISMSPRHGLLPMEGFFFFFASLLCNWTSKILKQFAVPNVNFFQILERNRTKMLPKVPLDITNKSPLLLTFGVITAFPSDHDSWASSAPQPRWGSFLWCWIREGKGKA